MVIAVPEAPGSATAVLVVPMAPLEAPAKKKRFSVRDNHELKEKNNKFTWRSATNATFSTFKK